MKLFYDLFYFDAVQRKAMKTNVDSKRNVARGANFTAATDSRNRKVRGLWVRNGRFYLQFRVAGEKSARRVPLFKEGSPALTLTDAQEARAVILHERRNGDALPSRGQKPTLATAITDYIAHHRRLAERDEAKRKSSAESGSASLDAPKKLTTVRKEELILAKWRKHITDIRLDRIGKPHVTAYLESVLEDGKTRRTRNVHLSIFRNMLGYHADKGVLIDRSLPTAGVKLLKHRTPKRDFLNSAKVQTLIAKATERDPEGKLLAGPSGQELADLIRLLAYCGAREMEALRLRWRDVDFTGRKLFIGRDGQTKNREARSVEFNPDLESLLQEIFARRAPDSPWIFPSPKRGDAEEHSHWANPHKVWYACRDLAKLPDAHLHDLRHHFASQCVMAGIDFMTIARWLGHLDGGILVGKTYGHLADEHKKAMAAKLLFTPRILPEAAAAS